MSAHLCCRGYNDAGSDPSLDRGLPYVFAYQTPSLLGVPCLCPSLHHSDPSLARGIPCLCPSDPFLARGPLSLSVTQTPRWLGVSPVFAHQTPSLLGVPSLSVTQTPRWLECGRGLCSQALQALKAMVCNFGSSEGWDTLRGRRVEQPLPTRAGSDKLYNACL